MSAASTDLVRHRPLPIYNFQMDRLDTIRLLKALVAAGMDTCAPKANAWIQKKALEIGLATNLPAPSHMQEMTAGWLMPRGRVGLP
jgi:hypothetical protein